MQDMKHYVAGITPREHTPARKSRVWQRVGVVAFFVVFGLVMFAAAQGGEWLQHHDTSYKGDSKH